MTTLFKTLNVGELKLFAVFICVNFIRIILCIYTSLFVKSRKHCLPAIDDDILLKPAIEIANEVRQGKIKSKDVIEAYLRRIKAVNPKINAIVDINKNAVKIAEEIDERVRAENSGTFGGQSIHDMPLLGVPVSIKDSIAVKGLLFTGGLYARRKTIADEDSDVVANLRKAGAIPIAITNVPELLMWSDTKSLLVGSTRNPYDLSCSAGGSSGGEAALISAAGSVIGIGSDVGGSLRIPSFRCGIFAHKVTPCVMPRNGLFPAINDILNPLFTTGPMCRYACDIIPTLKAAAGGQIKHLISIDKKVDLSKIRIFYMFEDKNILRPPLQQDLKDAVKNVLKFFQETYKVDCVHVNFEEFSTGEEVCGQILAEGLDFHKEMSNGRPKINLQREIIKSIVGLSEHTFPSLLMAYLCRLNPDFDPSKFETVKRLKQKFMNLLGTNGVFLFPTLKHVAPKIGQTLIDPFSLGDICIFNVIGVPVTQCPLGLNREGLPLGLQIAAAPYNDRLSIAVAVELEKAFGGWISPSIINTKSETRDYFVERS